MSLFTAVDTMHVPSQALAKKRADLVVVGAKGVTGVRHLLLGIQPLSHDEVHFRAEHVLITSFSPALAQYDDGEARCAAQSATEAP